LCSATRCAVGGLEIKPIELDFANSNFVRMVYQLRRTVKFDVDVIYLMEILNVISKREITCFIKWM